MTRQAVHQSSTTMNKNQPLLTEAPSEKALLETPANTAVVNVERKEMNVKRRFAEVAGGTAADCAAVCCCCPCSLMNLVLLALYKVPATLCKKARKGQRCMRKKKQRQTLLGRVSSKGCREELEKEVREIVEKEKIKANNVDKEETEAFELDKEMWDQFYETGFWRSPSQRGT